MSLDERRIINGTYGEVWLADSIVVEAFALQAKIEKKKEEVAICGRPGMGTKTVGFTGKGTLKVRKVNSRMALLEAENIRIGKDVRYEIISKLADPDAYGSERILLKDVSFDDLTLADWEAAKNGDVEIPFTFSDFELYDKITPR